MIAPTIAASLVAAAKPLPGVFAHLEPTLRQWGYLAVAVVVLVENFGVPLPGETILIAAALYAGTGRMSIWLVAVVAVVASVIGASVGYVIGQRGGRRLIERYGRAVRLTPERIDRVETFFDRRGGWLITFGRYVEGVRQFLSIIVGMSEMAFPRFLLFTVIGAALWTATWSALGYFAGDHVETVAHDLGYVGIAALVVVVLLVVLHLRRRRSRTTSEDASGRKAPVNS